jgi:hypothetical protein
MTKSESFEIKENQDKIKQNPFDIIAQDGLSNL